jgi:MFS family permease
MPDEMLSASGLGGRFRLLWAASAASNLADGVSMVALPLLAASLTRDPLQIAAVAAAQRLPWLLFVLVSGVVIDRSDRRRLQQGANLGRTLLLVVLGAATLAGWSSIPLLLGVALLLSIAETLADTAAVALLPAVVERDDLERANGRLYTTQTVANEFVGPPVGGGLFALAAAAPLLLVAACYGLAAALVSLLRGNFQPLPRDP